MASHLTIYTPSVRSLRLTQASIVLLVIITGIVSAVIVRSQWERDALQPEPTPITQVKTWEALGR
ncbi:hypothetical protein [Halomicronema sp. CCY15110]|uniref:hypothetical protein n=1 Tax=Halomicronema sp. CCY15110 TaxID=2767773 RepID=UPI0019516051|nr:hypothetical protein [Halomicronema sp. CCY15110]